MHIPKKGKGKIQPGIPGFKVNPEKFVLRPAVSVEDYIRCFRLLHDVYVQTGLTDPLPIPLRIVPHHSDPESKVFMGDFRHGQSMQLPVYTISLFSDNEQGLPIDEAFQKEVDILRKQGRRLVEAGCLASNPAFRTGNQNIPMLGNRLILNYASQNLDADDLLITVHPRHLKIYENILLFEKIGEISSYSYVNGKPAVALRLNLNTMVKAYQEAYAGAPIEKDLHHFFFVAHSDAIDLSGEESQRFADGMPDMMAAVFKAYSAENPFVLAHAV